MKLRLSIFLLLLGSLVFAQSPRVKQWDKRFGGIGREQLVMFIQTTDNGFLLGGISGSGATGDKTQNGWGSIDFWIVKTDAQGNKQWDKRFGTIDYDQFSSLCQSKDGGYLLGGSTKAGISGDKTQATRDTFGNYGDYWIIKIDSLGNKLWDKRYGGYLGEGIRDIQSTTDGGYILGGVSQSPISGDKTQSNWSNGASNFWIVKIDSIGNKLWDRRYGGTYGDNFRSVHQTTDEGYILGGYTQSAIGGDITQPSWDIGNFKADYWMIKIDSLGNKQWDKRYGGTGLDLLLAAMQAKDGGYILGGFSSSDSTGDKTQHNLGYWDYWLVKTDSNGNKQWDKSFGTDSSDGGSCGVTLFRGGSVILTNDNGYLISGSTNATANGDKTENNLDNFQPWLVKIDSLGNKQWDKTIFLQSVADECFGNQVIQTHDGCYVIANFTSAGIGGYKTQPRWDTVAFTDYWIVKLCDSLTAETLYQVNTSGVSPLCMNGCNGSATAIASYGYPPYHYQWYSNDSSASIDNLCAGNYPVTVTDASGAVTIDTVSVTNPVSLPANIFSNTTIFCSGDSTPLCVDSTFAIYQWNTGVYGKCIYATNAGNYYVTVTDNIGCTAESNHIAIDVHPLPPVSISVNGDTLIAYNSVSYQWYLNGIIIDEATSNVFIASEAGSYTVAVTDSNGCSATSNAMVITGIINWQENRESIYPNPATDKLSVSFDTEDRVSNLTVYDIQGIELLKQNIPQQTTPIHIDIKNLPNGFYLLQLRGEGKIIATSKFVKQ